VSALQHIAFIMDGNRRWADRHGYQRVRGHKEGIMAIERVIAACIDNSVPYVSFYAFSKENWDRDKYEIRYLLRLMRFFLVRIEAGLASRLFRQTRVRFIGALDDFPAEIGALMRRMEGRDLPHVACTAVVAVSYSGREEILAAAAAAARAGESLTAAALGDRLQTAGIPDPDIIVRTSGVQRLSNFQPWQSIYSELLFIEKLWPDIAADDVAAVVDEYRRRDRRFGR
jgi:undecaprenyl diphosphate synthase